MGELPGDLRLAEEAPAHLGLLFEVAHHHFHRDSSAEHLVLGREYHAHRARADALDDAVAADILRQAVCGGTAHLHGHEGRS